MWKKESTPKSFFNTPMNTCDYVVYEGDPSDAFGSEVGDFIKSKRDWAPISGSISAISKGHLDICRDLFNQPAVSDMCVSGNLGVGMASGGGGGLGGYNFPNALGGGGGGRRGAERLGDQSFGQQRLGERLSQGSGVGGRPSPGDFLGGGGDGGAGSFLWSYDPCSNQNCATSGGGQKGFSGLGSSISGFGRKTLSLPGGEGEGGSGSGGLGRGDPRMMEGGSGREPRAGAVGAGIAYAGGHEIEVGFSWSVGTNSGDLNFLVSYRDLTTGEHLGHRNGGCNVGGDPNCAAAAAAMAAAIQPGSTPAQVGAASQALRPYNTAGGPARAQAYGEAVKKQKAECDKNPNSQACADAKKQTKKAQCELDGKTSQQCDEEAKGQEACEKNPNSSECKDFCEKNPNDPSCKPPSGGGDYPACDIPGSNNCNGDWVAFVPIAKLKEFLESGGKKGLVSYPLPEGETPPPEAPGAVPEMDPLVPLINPVPDEVGGSTTFASNSTPCGSAVQDIQTGIGGGSRPTKGTLIQCPEGTTLGPQGCRPIVDTPPGGGGGGGCPPGKPGCGPDLAP